MKVIIEMMVLTPDEITRACNICVRAGASFVKTGTGWAERGTTLEDVRLVKSIVGDRVKIKASGGIRRLDTLLAMYEAGARRFGVNLKSGIQIVEEAVALQARLRKKQMDQKIISFDLGTGGNKASLYDADGNCLASAFVPYPTAYPQVGWHEQRPEDWWNAVVDSARQLIQSSGVNKDEIVCLGISGHSLGAVPVDARRKPAARRHAHLVGCSRPGRGRGLLHQGRSGEVVHDDRQRIPGCAVHGLQGHVVSAA